MRTITMSKFRTLILGALLLVPLVLVAFNAHHIFAAAGACTAPSTDYGTVTSTVNVSGTGTYRIWTRMAAPDTTNNTYMIQIDGNQCYTVGGSTIPTYASGATTFFASGTTNWTSKTSAGTQIDVSLTAGSHTFVLIGNAPGVVVDRLVLTQDTSCQPTGTGDNCANPPDTTPPVVNITAPTNGATISSTTTATATATDDVAVAKVEFYVDGTLQTTDTSSPYNFSINPASFTAGTHSLTAKAYDTSTSGNPVTSSAVSFTVVTPQPTPYGGTAPTLSANSSSPTKIEAENYDLGGEGVAYHDTDTANNGGSTYRGSDGVDVKDGSAYSNTHAIGWNAVGEWRTYTVTVSTAGTYNFTAAMGDPNGGGTIHIADTNGTNLSGAITIPNTGSYTTYANTTAAPLTLSAGTHVLKLMIDTGTSGYIGDMDYMTFTFQNQTTTYAAADINQDTHVNLQDFSLLVGSQFPRSGTPTQLGRADINGDGSVNLQDFSLLVGSQFPR